MASEPLPPRLLLRAPWAAFRRGEGDGPGDGLGDGLVDGLGDGSPLPTRLPCCSSSAGSRVRRGVGWPFSVCSTPSLRPDTNNSPYLDETIQVSL